MNDPLIAATRAASNGLFAQSTRMRVVSENIANADSTGKTAGADPYQRKTVNFESVADEASGTDLVQVEDVSRDQAPFRTEYMPGHPAADAKGYVKMPNVDMMTELADMREASRSYTANTQVIKQVREIVSMTIDLLRS
ncbi:flagellar basal body rod protein FlgC [Hyphomicrobium sp. B1]|jgi:flagellar basal-body rod protein FlgC|uniref:flagellar basal body rod protein FlgC n=1 Tax=unclassified Hyphomicrobium TaxID=2619925 RepID=UPI000213DB4E|nr:MULTISPECIES: flagellar basal body rod protein FlgC [unclassified Hyphomicrobium]CCB67553.1 flagellar biosynthesis; cell-proximal portion of basal-body rod [Hyphomicrobium sp. MC1]